MIMSGNEAWWSREMFSGRWRKVDRDGADITLSGRLFQTVGPADDKSLSERYSNLVCCSDQAVTSQQRSAISETRRRSSQRWRHSNVPLSLKLARGRLITAQSCPRPLAQRWRHSNVLRSVTRTAAAPHTAPLFQPGTSRPLLHEAGRHGVKLGCRNVGDGGGGIGARPTRNFRVLATPNSCVPTPFS